eukprot:COSAG04_NODE_6014_length_1431_cov_34.877778_2_plen_278_part_00
MYGTLGDLKNSLALYTEALDGRRRVQGNDHADTQQAMGYVSIVLIRLGEGERALALRKEALNGRRRLLGPNHPDTLDDAGNLGCIFHRMGEFAKAAPLLEEALDGLAALPVVVGFQQRLVEQFSHNKAANGLCLADPASGQMVKRAFLQERHEAEAQLPTASARVVGVKSRPELNGTEAIVKRFLIDKARYTVSLPATNASREPEKINLKPANLVLAEGSAVVCAGLTGAPELNGQKGKVEGWLEEKGRYVVRLDDKVRKKTVNLRPENCRADVLAL